MRFDHRQALRLVLIGTAAVSMAACTSRRPTTTAATDPGAGAIPPAGQDYNQAPNAAPRGSVGSTASGPAAGSMQDFAINVGERVFFDTDEWTVRPDARPVLEAQAAWLSRYPNVRVLIEGNADERGTREYNLGLGARRAQAVRDFLVAQGVAASRIETISYGKERPIDPGSSDEAFARNRNARTGITSGAQVSGRIS